MQPAAATEMFVIVAFTDAIGAEAIVTRILAGLAASPRLKKGGLTYRAGHRFLPQVARRANESLEDHVGRVAMDIENMTYPDTSTEVGHRE
jgi:hypothetical protein